MTGLGRSPDEEALVEAIVGLGPFDLDLVAEGIETEEQRVALVRMGCRGGQGWLFSKATAAAKAEEYLEAHSAAQPAHDAARA